MIGALFSGVLFRISTDCISLMDCSPSSVRRLDYDAKEYTTTKPWFAYSLSSYQHMFAPDYGTVSVQNAWRYATGNIFLYLLYR